MPSSVAHIPSTTFENTRLYVSLSDLAINCKSPINAMHELHVSVGLTGFGGSAGHSSMFWQKSSAPSYIFVRYLLRAVFIQN